MADRVEEQGETPVLDEFEAVGAPLGFGCERLELDETYLGSDHPLAELAKHGCTRVDLFKLDDDETEPSMELGVQVTIPATPFFRPQVHGEPIGELVWILAVGSDGERAPVQLWNGGHDLPITVPPEAIPFEVWTAAERLHDRILAECQVRAADGRPIIERRLERYSTDEEEERWPDTTYDLTGRRLPPEHPARALQDVGFTECGFEDNGNLFHAEREVSVDWSGTLADPAEGLSFTLQIICDPDKVMSDPDDTTISLHHQETCHDTVDLTVEQLDPPVWQAFQRFVVESVTDGPVKMAKEPA